jgi:ribonuclease HI
MCFFTDATVREKLAAVAVVRMVGIRTYVARQEVIGWAKTCSVLAAELAASAKALEYAYHYLQQTQIILFSDSQRALRVIQYGMVAGSKRMLLYRISEATARLVRKNTKC